MSELRDWAEGLEDSDRLLADVWKWLDGMSISSLVFTTDRQKAEELKTAIAEHLRIT